MTLQEVNWAQSSRPKLNKLLIPEGGVKLRGEEYLAGLAITLEESMVRKLVGAGAELTKVDGRLVVSKRRS